MQSLMDNKPRLAITVVVGLILLAVVVYVVVPALRKCLGGDEQTPAVEAPAEANAEEGYEQFESEAAPVEAPAKPEAQAEEAAPKKDGDYPTGPYVDSQTGTLIDGPGFEKQEVDDVYREPSSSIPSNYYFLDDGAGGEMSIQHNLCSRSCCSEQWPTPFKRKYDPYVCGNKDKFVPSRIMCSNSFQDAGCLCLTKKQAAHLYNRGGNGREWF